MKAVGLGRFLVLALASTACVSGCKKPASPATNRAAAGGNQAVGKVGTVSLFGIESSADRVCYVYDYGGEILEGLLPVRAEIKASVARLAPGQSFDVIPIFDSDHPFASNPLAPADADHKARLGRFLDESVPGRTDDPVPALEHAFSLKPQVVYVITNGDFPDNRAVRDWLAAHNRDKAVVVNTIAFGDAPDTDTEFIELLKEIAGRNGGQFRLVRLRHGEPEPSRSLRPPMP